MHVCATGMPRAGLGPQKLHVVGFSGEHADDAVQCRAELEAKRARVGQNAPRWIGRDVREYE